MAAGRCCFIEAEMNPEEDPLYLPEGLSQLVKLPYKYAIRGRWDRMYKFLEKHIKLRMFLRFSLPRDNALHLAAYSKDLKIFKDTYNLVTGTDVIPKDEESLMEELGLPFEDVQYNQMVPFLPNSYGNTVLHEAVIAGNLDAVKFLVGKHEQLLEYQNNSGETPFFRAASLGHADIVEFLASRVLDENKLKHIHRQRTTDDSMPIVCIALQGEHFETALKLLKLDRSLGEMEDAQGLTGLHFLASMPSAFKSGYPMNIFTTLIYFCLPVKAENEEPDEESEEEEEARLEYLTPQEVEIVGKDRSQNSQSSHSTCSNWLANCCSCIVTFLFGYSAVLSVKRLYLLICEFIFEGWPMIERIWNEKKKHAMSLRIAKLLAKKDKSWLDTWQEEHRPDQIEDESNNNLPDQNELNTSKESDQEHDESATEPPVQNKTKPKNTYSKPEIPLFTAARNGIIEIVETILEKHPQAIEFVNHEQQNILHIAVMYRKVEVFNFIKLNEMPVMRMKHQIDCKGYTLLHQAADMTRYPGGESEPVLDLQDELKWFERVKNIVPSYYQRHPESKNNWTPWTLFSEHHKGQLDSAKGWIKDTSQSCSTVAVLFATVVFAAVYQVPGGTDDHGIPRFLNEKYFKIFTVMDVVALAASLTAVVLFLSILSSPFRFIDFHHSLPRRLTLGFAMLLFSVITTMLAFGATILLIINLQQGLTTSLISVSAFLPVSVFALLQFRLYVAFAGNVWEFFKEVYSALPWFCVPFHKINKRGLKCKRV